MPSSHTPPTSVPGPGIHRQTVGKGQLISKAIYGLLTSPKKTNGRICFVCFFTLHSKQIKIRPFVYWENLRLTNLLFDFIQGAIFILRIRVF